MLEDARTVAGAPAACRPARAPGGAGAGRGECSRPRRGPEAGRRHRVAQDDEDATGGAGEEGPVRPRRIDRHQRGPTWRTRCGGGSLAAASKRRRRSSALARARRARGCARRSRPRSSATTASACATRPRRARRRRCSPPPRRWWARHALWSVDDASSSTSLRSARHAHAKPFGSMPPPS